MTNRLVLVGVSLIAVGGVLDAFATQLLASSDATSYYALIYVGGSLVFLGLVLIGAGIMSKRVARSRQPVQNT